jgi:hypothetical protein
MHEIGHSLCREYSNKFSIGCDSALNQFEEELLVNDFASAYWQKFAQQDFLKEIIELINIQIDKVDHFSWDDTCKKLCKIQENNYKIFYRKYAHLSKLENRLMFSDVSDKENSDNYNNFQNFSIKESLNKDINLNKVLEEIGILDFYPFKDYNKLNYIYNIDTPKEVISDATKIFLQHNIIVPPITYCIEENKGCNHMKFDKL